MKRGVFWRLVSGGMAVALLLASCAPAVVEKEEEKKVAPPVEKKVPTGVTVPKEVAVPEKKADMVKWTGKKLDGTVVEKMIEKPKYGGIYVFAYPEEPIRFDDVMGITWNIDPVNEELIIKDWTRGPGGTAEWDATLGVFPSKAISTGLLAESWEVPDDETMIFHIRPGVHWQDKSPMNGRELTGADVVYSTRRMYKKGTHCGAGRPDLSDMENNENSIYLSPADKWTMVVKVKPGQIQGPFEGISDHCQILPPEVLAQYGDMNDWKNVVGTGPFILKDYVGGSSLTYVRNPNYWRHDPFFPKNQLPYIDTLKALIVPDSSTRQAGIRAGRIDSLSGLTTEEAQPLLKSNPELEWLTSLNPNPHTIQMRNDTTPFTDIRVRRALAMAINNQEILDSFYGGEASLMSMPSPPAPEFKDLYIPLEQLPESVREQYEYHPDKAKQLLAEAGYPDGFKTQILITQPWVDLFSIVKSYWADIGVDLKLDVRESGVVASVMQKKTYTQMVVADSRMINPWLLRWARKGVTNYGMINDPKAQQTYEAMNALFLDEAKRDQLMRDFALYAHEKSWFIVLPTPHVYTLWQPWLKGFYGASNISYMDELYHSAYIWIDQELKEAMGR